MFTLSSPPRAPPPIFSLPDKTMSMTPSHTRTTLFNFSAPNTPQHHHHQQTQTQTTPSRLLRSSPPTHTNPLFSPNAFNTHTRGREEGGEGTGTGAGTYAHRYATTISNPLRNAPPRAYTTSASPSARTARRNLFLNRIKQDRDAGRFEARGEQLVLMEGVAEQKQWGEAMRRRADRIGGVGAEYESEYGYAEYGIEDEVSEAELRALDEYLVEEQMEMEMMGSEGGGACEKTSFSDDEYEDIFADLADRIPPSSSGQDMDMSSG